MYNKIQHGVLRFPPFLSEPCKNLIVALLNRDPTKRLGSKDDVNDIRSHAFFKDMSWDKLYKKEIEPAYKPKLKEKAETKQDTSNFDETFTKEPVVDSVVQGSKLGETANETTDVFSDFTFKQKEGHLS